MYRISEFSRITQLTVKALRYYDDEGILSPSFRGENRYRYYTDADFKKARMISLLRKFDFSIAEIREITENCEDAVDLSCYIAEKQSMIAAHIREEKELINRLSLYLTPNDTEEKTMDYQIELKEIAPITVISVRFRGKYSDIGSYFGVLYKQAKGRAAEAPFNCYYDDEYREEADIELCVPLKGRVPGGNGTIVKEMPRIKALCVTHTGGYDTLNLAYKAVLDYAEAKGFTCELPSREIYYKGPGMIFKGNPAKYVTEIVIPVAAQGK